MQEVDIAMIRGCDAILTKCDARIRGCDAILTNIMQGLEVVMQCTSYVYLTG